MTDADDPELLLSETDRTSDARQAAPRPPSPRRRWPWVLGGLVVAVPALFTLAGALTSPPHAKSVPVGHLIYLEADEPSDHTSILRGLRVMGPDGASRQLLHETEPQDSDSGSREWITQPKASPDGQWLAFEKQVITLQEEKQGVENQLWTMPLTGPDPKPRMVLDLAKLHLKQFIGLTWSDDDEYIFFLEDALAYSVPPDGMIGGDAHQNSSPLKDLPPLQISPDVSATHALGGGFSGQMDYEARTPHGTQVIVKGRPVSNASVVAEGPIRSNSPALAEVTTDDPTVIVVQDPNSVRRLPVRWGWSALGKRHITALRWSPDGKYLAYSVSKPPLEDELFYVELATGKCFQLPVRTGQAGWDWAR